MEGGGGISLAYLLRDRGREARGRGSVIHAWLEGMLWIEDGLPPERELRRIAREVAPELREVEGLMADLERWLQAPEVREVLSRTWYPAEAKVDRERPFLLRDEGRLVQGVVDRLVRAPSREGEGPGAWVLDFKTDQVTVETTDGSPGGDEAEFRTRVEFYRPQVETYRRAVAREEGLEVGGVAVGLVFLVPGRVIWL